MNFQTILESIGLPQWLSGKESPCSAGNSGGTDSISGSGRPSGRGHGNPLQFLAGKIPWTEETGGISKGFQRAGYDGSDWAHTQRFKLHSLYCAETKYLNSFAVGLLFLVCKKYSCRNSTTGATYF